MIADSRYISASQVSAQHATPPKSSIQADRRGALPRNPKLAPAAALSHDGRHSFAMAIKCTHSPHLPKHAGNARPHWWGISLPPPPLPPPQCRGKACTLRPPPPFLGNPLWKRRPKQVKAPVPIPKLESFFWLARHARLRRTDPFVGPGRTF